jgi:outer membrane protein insertion porin family
MVSLSAVPVAAQTGEALTAAAHRNNVIRSISVVGTQRLEADTVRSYIRLRVGQVNGPRPPATRR